MRVEESQEAPHAIQNSTKVYVREGSVTQPYELADIGRIEYLLKRREEAQRIIGAILDRIEERISAHYPATERPNLEILARPIFPSRPIISPPEIHEFMILEPLIPTTGRNIDLATRRVTGGACYIKSMYPMDYWELNEYGVVYHKTGLSKEPCPGRWDPGDGDKDEEEYLDSQDIGSNIYKFLENVKDFLERCKYRGDIEITVTLREIQGEKLKFPDDRHPSFVEERESVQSEVSAYGQCSPHELGNCDTYAPILIGLIEQLFWVFNVSEDKDQWRESWRKFVADKVGR